MPPPLTALQDQGQQQDLAMKVVVDWLIGLLTLQTFLC